MRDKKGERCTLLNSDVNRKKINIFFMAKQLLVHFLCKKSKHLDFKVHSY